MGWRLRRYMTRIRHEDRIHVWDGVDQLSELELAEACRKRAIPFHGLTEIDMQTHLGRWAQLSSQMDISMCLLLWIQSSFNLECRALSLRSNIMQRRHQIDKHQSEEAITKYNKRSLEIAMAMLFNKTSFEREKKMKVDEMQAQIDEIMNSLLEESDDLKVLTGKDERNAGFAPSKNSSSHAQRRNS